MFATHNDQENFVHGHQQVAASKPLNQGTRGAPPKTPGNKYPKTPLRVPLNDENAPTGYGGGKSVFGTKKKGNENLMTGGQKGTTFDKNAFVTPMGPRNRAPLGMKTTNAKTKAFQTPGPIGNKELDKTQPTIQTSARRPKKVSHAETAKLEIHGDDAGPLDVPDVEYAPPKPAELPYESDVFPDGCFNYDMFKGKNLMRGSHIHFSNPIDENGVSKREKEHDEAVAKALKEGEAQILKAMEEQDWSVGDVPETWPEHKQPKKTSIIEKRPPSTATARRAAAALSVPSRPATTVSKTITTAPKPKFPTSFVRSKKPATALPTDGSSTSHAAAIAASRTTLGYAKGRAVSAAIRPPVNNSALTRSSSNLSTASSASNITSAPLARKQSNEEASNLTFLKAFDKGDDESIHGFGGGLPKSLLDDEEEEEFVMTLNLK